MLVQLKAYVEIMLMEWYNIFTYSYLYKGELVSLCQYTQHLHCSRYKKLIFFHIHTEVMAEVLSSLPRLTQTVLTGSKCLPYTPEKCFGGLCV